jgi:PAS domain S-box-containing protein
VREDGRVALADARVATLFGYEPTTLIGQPVAELMPSLLDRLTTVRQPGPVEPYGVAIGTQLDLELPCRHRDGSAFRASVALSSASTMLGPLTCLAVRHEPTLPYDVVLQCLLQASPDAIIAVSATGRILLANGEAERLTGYGAAELIGQPVEVLVPDGSRGTHTQHRRGYLANPRPRPMGPDAELAIRRKDGSELPVEISLNAIRAGDGMVVTAAIRDVAERKHFQQVLRDKNNDLERALLAKDRFLANMSHELRTPLNAVIGFTGTLLMRLPGSINAEQERHLQTVQRSARHLLTIINDLLDLTKIESGRVKISVQPVDCAALAADAARTASAAAAEKGLDLTLDTPTLPVVASADRRVLTQIVTHLLNNAIKFTPDGWVRVAVQTTDGDRPIQILVSDSGPGIPATEQDRLFRAFEQGGLPGRSGADGMGLGLYLSRRLAELVGADLTLLSKPGLGSTFTLSLTRFDDSRHSDPTAVS